jgi:hypothetical protein
MISCVKDIGQVRLLKFLDVELPRLTRLKGNNKPALFDAIAIRQTYAAKLFYFSLALSYCVSIANDEYELHGILTYSC